MQYLSGLTKNEKSHLYSKNGAVALANEIRKVTALACECSAKGGFFRTPLEASKLQLIIVTGQTIG